MSEGPTSLPLRDGDTDETPWKMLHPASLAVNLLPRAWGFVRGWWPVLLVAFWSNGGGLDTETLADGAFFLLFGLGAVGNTVVHFLTLRYRVHRGRLEIRSGLLNRNKRVLSPDKVQNVEMVRNLFHRMSGLVEVRIETASGDEVEGLLSALTVEEASLLVHALSSQRRRARDPEAPAAPVLTSNTTRDLLRYGATSTRVGGTAVVVAVLMEAAGLTDPEWASRLPLAMGVVGIAAGIIALLVGAWLLGIVNAAVRHHGFSLSLDQDALVAEEGLFTRRRVELPVHKVQLVSVVEPWLRRLFGIGSMIIETAAARAGTGGTQRSLTMVPLVERHDVDRLVAHALPQVDVDLARGTLRPPSPRALTRGLIRAILQGFVVSVAATLWWGPWGALSVVAIPGMAVLAWLDWKHQGWAITDEVVVSRRGYLNRRTQVVARAKLQSVDVDQGPLQRRYGLGEILLRVAGSSVAMPLLDHDEAFAIAAHLSASVAADLAAAGGGFAPSDRPSPAAT